MHRGERFGRHHASALWLLAEASQLCFASDFVVLIFLVYLCDFIPSYLIICLRDVIGECISGLLNFLKKKNEQWYILGNPKSEHVSL